MLPRRHLLISVQSRIDNILRIAEEKVDDPDVTADTVILMNLLKRLEHFLMDEQQLPRLQEDVQRLKGHTLPPQGTPSRTRMQLEERELALACAERGIEDWNRMLPEWQDTYESIAAHILAGSSELKACLLEPDYPAVARGSVTSENRVSVPTNSNGASSTDGNFRQNVFQGLKNKKTDLSMYMNNANLTERQHDCFSLKHEYGQTMRKIGVRLGLHHSTVAQHLAAATKNIEHANQGRRLPRQK